MLFHQVVISHIEIATFSIFHYERCTFASFPMLHNMRNEEDGCCSFLSAKVVRGLWLSKGLRRLVCLENLHTVGSYFPTKPCASPPRYLYFATKRNQHTPIFGRIKKMSLWISKK